jgi:hypothetical protein
MTGDAAMAAPAPSKLKRTVWYVLLFIPFFVAIWVPLFNRIEPSFYGIPFFYWFQFVLIVIAAIVTGLAYLAKI